MLRKILRLSLILGLFTAQGGIINAQALVPMTDTSCPVPENWKSEEINVPGAPTWKDLVDSKAEWGVNLYNVFERQEKNRRSNKLVGTDPSVAIANITSSKQKLKDFAEINIPYVIENDKLDAELVKLTKKFFKNKEEKERISQIKKEKEDLRIKRNDQLALKKISTSFNPEEMKKVIKELQGRAVADLGQYGLTCQQILLLPARELGEKVSNWKSSD